MRQLIINSGKRRFALFITLFLVVGLFSTFGASASGVAAKKTDSAPAQPSGLKAEADNHSVMLTWNENTTDDDLLMYVLEYKRASEKWRNVPITDAAATTCRIGDLINYERYQFRLKVQDNNLNWSKYSDIVFATPADATLKDLRVDGETVADFSPDTLTYDAPLPFGTTVVPKVTASVNDRAATAVVTNATGLPGSATVVVNAKATKDGRTQRTYTVHFTLPFTVSFVSNGGGHVEPIHVNSGQALGVLPVPNLPGSIFLGWYTDDNSFERAVSEDTQVTSDLTLYARYAAVAEVEEANKDLFVSAMDCEAGFAIDILSSDSAMSSDAVKAALQLEVLDNTAFAGLSVSGGVGAYSVTATEGYTPGSSYKLTLKNAALSFAGEPGSARTYCFTIHKPVVMNLRLDPGVTETPASEISDMTINGLQASGLSVPLASVGTDLSEIGDTGTFTYNGSEQLAVGDVMAIYMGTPLDQRDPTVDYSDQAVAYVEVIAIDGATVTYRTAEAQDVLFTPDILPVDWADDVDGDPGNYAITIAVSDMTYTGEDFAEMGLDADTVVEKGDFLAFYDGSPPAETEQVTFACINSVELSGSDYLITYSDVTEDELASAMDLYASYDKNYEQAVEDIDLPAMEADIERQAVESGFVDAAADYLTDMAQNTDGFQGQLGEVNLLGESTSESTAEISNLKVNAAISTSLKHFVGLQGLRCAVTVSFDVACGDTMNIHLSGTFVEEIRTTLKASGGAVWKTKKVLFVRIPYIADYRMNASVDLYNFTGIDISATITTSEGTVDIAEQIKAMMGTENYQSEDISAETQAFYELYGDMLANEHDYVEVFSQEIYSKEAPIDPYHILVGGLSLDFVVNADVNLSLGCHFAYEKGTRYVFSLRLFAKTATSDQLDLVDENYSFQFYVMGTLGLRAGIVVRIELGMFTLKAGSIGIEAETGPYVRMWGYFFYELEHANHQTTSTASGALYLELGMYLEVRFLAQALDGRYSYNPTLYEHEWPLWDAGSRSNVFDYSYVLTDDADDIYFKADNTTYALPSSVFSMKQLDLKQGGVTVTPYSSTSFTITFTNSSFSQANGIVTVHQPVGQDITEGYMTVYWNGGPLSFTSVPISRTYHVVWDDLADRYMISFNSQGGSLVSAIIGAYQSPVTTLPQPTRAGYSFGGWYGNEACSGQAYTATTMPAMNVQLYAKWTANAHTPYTVRHYLQTVAGSAYELAAAGTQTLTGTTDTGVTPAVNTYVGFTAPEAQTVAINGDGSTVVEYYYARNSYQLTFKPRNGDPDVVRTLAYGGEISAPQVTRAGYVFDAWYSDKDPNDVYTFTTMPAEQLTLQAGWIPTSARMEISTELSSGVDGTALVGGYVHDTITLTWEGPSGDGPTGSIKVTMRTPGGRIWVVCNQVITAPTSPFSFTTTDQGLSELGLYQFKAEYIPDADSVFAGAVSDFEAVTTVEGTVTISTLLSTGVDATVTSPAWVDDTITLTWPQSGFVPTGSIKVTCKMPGGETYVVCDQVITATTSPFSFTTEEQGLGTGEMWEGGLLGPGLYQFQAEYIPDAGSLFAGAVSAYEDEQVTVLVPPVFAWEEISETGTAVADPDGGEYGFYDDFTFGPFPVGFSFPFYGNTFDSFYVSTNGWISFTEPTSFFNRPTPLPNLDAPFNLVAPFWDDLSVYTGGQNIYYLYDGEKLIVEYKNVHRYGDIGASYTFEVFLYPDGNMVFQYQSMTGPRDWATVGVQNETGNEGLQIASSEDYVEDGLAVRVCPFAGVYTWADNLGRGGN